MTGTTKRSNRAAMGWLIWTLAVAVSLAVTAPAGAQEEGGPLEAGASTSNITPPLGSLIIGNWGQPEATHIHDELYVRSLVLRNGDDSMVIVVCDNLSIDREVFDQARQRLHEKTGIAGEHMLMSATHTHSGPSARQGNGLDAGELTEYQQFVADRVVDGVLRAINQLEPAQVGFGSGSEPEEVFNRRWHVEDTSLAANPFGGEDKVRMNPPRGHDALIEPAGPTDPEIAFLSVQSADGRPIALLANYSLHYVGGVPRGHISADYFGMFAQRIEQMLQADRNDPPFVGILSNGTSGDINNINFTGSTPRREPYEQMRRVADRVAAEVFSAYQKVEYHDDVPLAGRLSDLRLQVRKPDEETLDWADDILAQSEEDTTRRQRIYARRASALHESPDYVDIPVQAVRVGDVGIAAIPFEVFAETGLQIKEEAPLPHAFTISFGNGGYGYLPSPRHYELGGYETWLGTSRVEQQAEPKIVDRLMEHFAELTDD